jgi:hypothetical protein
MNGYDENNDAGEKATAETLWWWADATENLARIKWLGYGRIL